MTTSVLSLQNSSATSTTPPTTATPQGSSDLGQDQFLQLLVAQLQNQDPTQPQDPTAFVSQLAQFSSLEQQTTTNTKLDSLILAQSTTTQTAASSLLGQQVSYSTSNLNLGAAGTASANVGLAGNAAQVTIHVANSSGTVVRTLNLGAQQAGNIPVTWDGHGDDGTIEPAGQYTLSGSATDASGNAVALNLASTGLVTGVSFGSGGSTQLNVNGSLINMSNVTSINERNTP